MCLNKNGHDKKNPRLELAPEHVPDHPILYAVYTLFRAAVVKLYLHPQMFPSLRTPSGKKKKSDRMEGICLTLLAMVVCMDLRALLAATPVDDIKRDSWLGRSIAKLAEIAGIGYWRCKRAIADMREASFIGVWRVTVESEGQKKGRPSLRRLPEDFIKALGIWRAFSKLRKLYDQMVKEANEEWEEAQEAAHKLAAQSAGVAKETLAKVGRIARTGVEAVVNSMPPVLDWRDQMVQEFGAKLGFVIQPKPKPT